MDGESGTKGDKDRKGGKDGVGDTKDDQQRNRDKDERRVRKIMDGESGVCVCPSSVCVCPSSGQHTLPGRPGPSRDKCN
jgi:hypothetical protein